MAGTATPSKPLADDATLARRLQWAFRRLSPQLEAEYAGFVWQNLRWGRVGLFLALFVSFATAPFYQVSLLQVPQHLQAQLAVIELAIVAPLTLVSALVCLLPAPRSWAYVVQGAALAAALLAILLLRFYALTTSMDYPVSMIGIALVSITLFGAYSWLLLAPVTILFTTAAVFLEFRVPAADMNPWLRLYVLLFLAMCAVFGALNQHVLSRRRWWGMISLRATRDALQQSETRFQEFIENTPTYAWIKDDEGRYLTVNRAFRERFVQPDESWIGRRTEDFFPQQMARRVADTEQQVRISRQALQYESPAKDQQGEPMHLLVHKFPLSGPEGRTYVGAVSIDMTERKRMELEWRDSESRFLLFLDSLNVMAWIKDDEGRFVYINQAARDFINVQDPLDWRGRTNFDFVPRDVAKTSRDLELWVLETNQAFESIQQVPDNAGEMRQLKVVRFAFTDASGRRYIGGWAMDITQMLADQQAAEAALKSKSQFLANMSHEIRTPMNAIVGMTGVLLDSPLSVQQQQWVHTIRDSGDHLIGVISDILNFSRIEAGEVKIETRSFAFRDCIESTLDIVAGAATTAGVDVAFFTDPDVPEILHGDVVHLRQIVLNLLSNAIKFTPSGGLVRIEASCRRRGQQCDLQVTVTDTGVGIELDQIDRLFKPFSQVDCSPTRSRGGTGLGLSICKRLLDFMGGSIWVHSKPGQGSTFGFVMPMFEGTPEQDTGEACLPSALRGRRALIMSDQAVMRELLTHYCEQWQMTPVVTDDADRALSHVRAGEAGEVLLVACTTPEQEGLALARSISALPDTCRKPPVILVVPTAADGVSDDSVATCVAKPIRSSRLRALVVDVLGLAPPAALEPTPFEIPRNLADRHPLRILVAEDNSVNQQVFRLLLNRLGYEADFVGDGEQALAAIERQSYDVVFMDVQMPVMDGLTATRELCRRLPAGQRPRVVGVSANALDESREQAEAAGMDAYIVKPFMLQTLVEAIERIRPQTAVHAG